MKNTLKIVLFFTIILAVLLVVPSICNAANIEVNEGEDLVQKISEAADGDTIILNADFEISVIEITNKTLTIDGNDHTISGIEGVEAVSGKNQTLISASVGSSITLENLTLTNSPKYGVQAYNGGKVILKGVEISECGYGGVLNNGGVVEIQDLTLGFNGDLTNNGIEMGKGSSLEGQDVEPILIMNGTLTSSEKENVIYIAENDEISSFKVQNIYDTTVDKIYVDGNKIVITDSNNSVKFESNESERVTTGNASGDTYFPNPTITIEVPNMPSISFEIQFGGTLTQESLESKIDLSDTNLVIDGFFIDKDYKDEFDFRGEVQSNITLYAKLSEASETVDPEKPSDEEEKPAEEEKDDTPKTGVSNYIGIAATIAVVSLATIVVIKKKNA